MDSESCSNSYSEADTDGIRRGATPDVAERRRAMLDILAAAGADIPLADALRAAADSARRVVRCRYAVITVVGENEVEHFTPDGASPDVPAHSGWLLHVPISNAGRTVGSLRLAERVDGKSFDADDDQVARLVAAAAAALILRARITRKYEQWQRWLAESAELTRLLLSSEPENPLRLVIERVAAIADADLVAVLTEHQDAHSFEVLDAVGTNAGTVLGRVIDAANSVAAQVLDAGEPRVVTDLANSDRHRELVRLIRAESAILLPLAAADAGRGMLAVFRRHGHRPFTDDDVEATTSFAAQMSLALQLAEIRAQRERSALLDERDRIARDLHDHVIQRLFAIGLSVQGVASRLGPETGKALFAAVEDLDDTIGQIRATIYRLSGPIVDAQSSIRTRVARVVDEMTGVLGFRPELEISGPVDFAVGPDITDDCVAVAREALTNVARHARANAVNVTVAFEAAQLTVDVRDDGCGIPESGRRSGLANLRARAERYGGTLSIDSAPTAGTRLIWQVPIGG